MALSSKFILVIYKKLSPKVTRLCDLSADDSNTVTSVSWSERGHQLSVGTHKGYVTVWDVSANKQVRKKVYQIFA